MPITCPFCSHHFPNSNTINSRHKAACAGWQAESPSQKPPACLYRHDVLAENNEQSTEADYEIVSINARVSVEPEPMHPLTMARNMLHLPGGTQGTYTAEEFARAIHFWSSRCMISGS